MSHRNSASSFITPWPQGHIDGIGNVPGGPSSSRQIYSGQMRTFQISTGSTAVIPEFASTQQEPFSGSDPSATFPKAEEVDDDIYTIPSVENALYDPSARLEEGEVKNELSLEERILPANNESYLNNFHKLFAGYTQRARPISSRSTRQEVYFAPQKLRDGHRSPASEQSDRSRSSTTQRLNILQDLSSPIFFPASQESGNSTRDAERGRSSTSDTSLSASQSPNSDYGESSGEGGSQCHCPISYSCAHRATNQLDCRPLVREWKSWKERQDQEAFDVLRIARSHGDTQTTPEVLRRIVTILDEYDQASTATERENAIHQMQEWILEMQDVTVEAGPQRHAVTREVLPRLNLFLDPKPDEQQHTGEVPDYIRESLQLFQIKWNRGDFDGSIRRGLVEVERRDVNEFVIRRNFLVDEQWEHFVPGQYFGEGSLVNGQIWMSRAELRRDGGHAPLIAGISGCSKKGAYSIVLGEFDEAKNIGYGDIDMGDVIDYMGTALPDEEGLGPTNIQDPHMNNPDSWNTAAARKPTTSTLAMMKSLETGNPVRVFRSWKMCKIVKNKPGKGYRYDGLYRVVGKTALKEARQIWSFRLERIPGQGRLRGFRFDEPPPDSSGRRKGHFYRQRETGDRGGRRQRA